MEGRNSFPDQEGETGIGCSPRHPPPGALSSREGLRRAYHGAEPTDHELDKNMKPITPMQFLGDEETVCKAMDAVAAQGKAKKGG